MAGMRAFKRAKTIAEVYKVAKELKAAGEDSEVVNEMMIKRRKELLMSIISPSKIKKINIPTMTPDSVKWNSLPVKFTDWVTGTIKIVGDTREIEL